ncbi:MAG: DUF1015 domain-containing protein [Dehalococcoidia bacterium]
MPQILPLRGLRYTAGAGSLSELLAPPYDVITPAQRQSLAARSPHNAVHLELAEGGEDRYAGVAALVEQWESTGILARDEAPMLYVYEQRFAEAGREYTRRAVIVGVEAQPWEEGAVKPHEFTMSGPKEDRLKLLEATKVQFSPVFMIARDRAGQLAQFLEQMIASRGPDAEGTTPEGDVHRFWAIEAGRYEMRFLAPLLSESFYIADGHHRYETAVNYKQRLAERGEKLERDHPARFALTAIVAASDPGLVIRPIHRIVPRRAPAGWEQMLEDEFDVTTLKRVGGEHMFAEEMESELKLRPRSIVALGMETGSAHILTPREDVTPATTPAGHSREWAAIAPNVLRYGMLEPLWGITDDDLRAGVVEYTHDTAEVVARVMAEPETTGFLLSPVGIDEVMRLADQGERMPQKSTFFHPKLGTGLVFHPLTP